jgi:hypothetical protein
MEEAMTDHRFNLMKKLGSGELHAFRDRQSVSQSGW